MLYHESHLMQDKNGPFEDYRHLTQRNTGDESIFTCAGFSVAIMWKKTSLFLLGFVKQCSYPYSPAPTPTYSPNPTQPKHFPIDPRPSKQCPKHSQQPNIMPHTPPLIPPTQNDVPPTQNNSQLLKIMPQ